MSTCYGVLCEDSHLESGYDEEWRQMDRENFELTLQMEDKMEMEDLEHQPVSLQWPG